MYEKNIIVVLFIYTVIGYTKEIVPGGGCCIYIIDGKKCIIALHLLVNW